MPRHRFQAKIMLEAFYRGAEYQRRRVGEEKLVGTGGFEPPIS
jgi:hypothetical protein